MRIATSAPATPAAGDAPADFDESVPGEGPPTGAMFVAGNGVGVDDAIPVYGTSIGPDTGSMTIYPPDTGSIPVVTPEGAETGTGWPATTGDPGRPDTGDGPAVPGEAGAGTEPAQRPQPAEQPGRKEPGEPREHG
jgi:hypothetical protein